MYEKYKEGYSLTPFFLENRHFWQAYVMSKTILQYIKEKNIKACHDKKNSESILIATMNQFVSFIVVFIPFYSWFYVFIYSHL